MFIFGHIGITLGGAFIIFQFVLPRIGIRLKKINYLFVALGAILPEAQSKKPVIYQRGDRRGRRV